MMRYLVKQFKDTRAVADALGISQRTVERYVKDQIHRPRTDLAKRLDDAVRKRWQPRVRERARRQAATSTGLGVDVQARFGFTAAPGTTDDARMRHLAIALPRSTRPVSSTLETPAPTSRCCAPSPPKASARQFEINLQQPRRLAAPGAHSAMPTSTCPPRPDGPMR
jgi:hypothetical protein